MQKEISHENANTDNKFQRWKGWEEYPKILL
jgi:hypothetical protein